VIAVPFLVLKTALIARVAIEKTSAASLEIFVMLAGGQNSRRHKVVSPYRRMLQL
jgi:hypothetical protein